MSDANSPTRHKMVTGLFPDRSSAERAYESVTERGYSKDDVNLIMSADARKRHFEGSPAGDTELGTKAAQGAGIGGVIGGSLGAIVAAVAAIGTSLVLPGIGLVVAGPLAAAFLGAGAGGATGGIIGALIGYGIPEERVAHYEEGIRNGGILMGVTPRSEEDALHFESKFIENNGQHVIGTGLGASAGGITGAAIGAVAGPIGIVVGAAVGAISGGLAGKGAAEVVNPDAGDQLTDHNLAKGVGASGGAVAGATVGVVGGPIGMAAGAAIGAIAGGLAGQGSAEVVNSKSDDVLGEHHLAKGAGASGGAVAGAALGTLGGPIGMVAGAAIGAVAGGAAGHGAATFVNPAAEDEYWRQAHATSAHANPAYSYDDYAPAYRMGFEGRARSVGAFEANENEMGSNWDAVKGSSRLDWEEAKRATRAAWNRIT
jgi:outer membrane lipoprotein SlyB